MKRNKITAMLLAVAMTASLLVGCGNSTGSESTGAAASGEAGAEGVTTDNITLTYWHYEDETTVNLMAEAFMKKYPNITVECKQIADMSTDLSAAAAAGTFPDVFSGTDSDTALANMYWADITEYVENDPDMDNMMVSIKNYGIGKFDTDRWFGLPTWYQPSAIFIDRNVIKKLNLEMPRTDWTWDEMIQLIKDATVDDRSGMKYYGLGFYNRLDSLYGIAACATAERAIKGEFGYDGNDFDLSYWAIGEQEFGDLQTGGYVAPKQDTQAMEDWSGDWGTWFGATGHVAVFSEGFWSYQNLWGTDGYQEQYGLDIVPYVTPNVVDEKDHNIIANMYIGGVSTSCKYPYEAYLLLKFMGIGTDGWKARLDIYEDESITNSSGVALKHANMPVPMTLDEEVWNRYKAMFPTDEDHKQYWDDYFASITRPVPYGWYSIAGYWNFCDQYFNKIGIHDLVDAGTAKAADYAAEATEQANYYHAEAMISYFGPTGYGVLSDEDLAKYQAVVDSFGQ
ncbi:MAG: ABC transporter substrate-binding protein [Lachnospiraceae bacterium]|nr:ABC transporter substrate-binding protein [Lachnospiraceae bacterium]